MSKSNIRFDVDRRSAKEGESITVTWDCGVPDSVSLRVDNGYRPFILQLADSGSRAIAIEKSKGKTTLRLTASCGTRKESREIAIKVKSTKVIKAKVPLGEMFGYATDLRSQTQGRASYTMQFDCYEPVPKSVREEIVAKHGGNA